MIRVLFPLIFAEMGLIMILLFKTPLRKLLIMRLDRVKLGRGPVIVKIIGGTLFLVSYFSLYRMLKIRKRSLESEGGVSPMDQVLMGKHLLEASLMGFTLFLGLMIHRLHHHVCKLRLLRESAEATKKQLRGYEDSQTRNSEVVKALVEEVASLKAKLKNLESVRTRYQYIDNERASGAKKIKLLEEEIKGLMEKLTKLESEYGAKVKEVKAAEANALALTKQSEGFLLEYDRLLEDNQNLRSLLQSVDRRISHSSSKKKM